MNLQANELENESSKSDDSYRKLKFKRERHCDPLKEARQSTIINHKLLLLARVVLQAASWFKGTPFYKFRTKTNKKGPKKGL